MSEKILNFIDGEFCEPDSQEYLKIENPARGEDIALLADSNGRDVERAVQAASRAFDGWSRTSTRERAGCLRRLATLIEENTHELAKLESLNTGKPFAVSRMIDIPRSAHNFEFFADAITQWSSQAYASERALNYVLHQPLGVVACISPWNLPLYLFTWKVAPALAAGNCVVGKPSEVTPLTASRLAALSVEAGIPKGVFNVIHGRGAIAGTALINHESIKAVSFTGSTRTGAEIARAVAPKFKKLSLELGGKNATVVFGDCDFERTVKETVRAAYSNQGQICLCGSRILVEKSIYEKFRDAVVVEIKKFKLGDPFASDTTQGSLVSAAHHRKVMACIEIAIAEGGRLLCGGQAAKIGNGYFVEPTLFEGLSSDCKTNQDEIFGPVATIAPFETESEALRLTNSTRYGLAASVWTRDLHRAHRFAQRIESGLVWVNTWMLRDLRTPFGGVKDSGVGREGGAEALRFFTETKNICIDSGAEMEIR